ncbi:MAG TPA: MFS transporter [Burkholderiaceae bacterium]|nr:MFS transporter [Burkholderiaceae bacterium]
MPLFDPKALNPGVTRREVFAWAGYDFANSGYTTVVLTAVFNAYFVGVVAQKATWATFAWTATLAVSNLLVMLFTPLIGAYADLHARKKRLLALSTFGCVVTTAALAFAGPGDLGVAGVAIIFSNFFFMVGVGLVSAFLPELSRPESLGKVSGWGWSFGYIGGLLTLGLCLGYVLWAQGQGGEIGQATHFVPVTMLIVAGVFLLAALPTLLILRERALPQPGAHAAGQVLETLRRLRYTLRHIGQFRDFGFLLLCTVFYQAGVNVVIALAAIYAQEVMKFTFVQTMTLILVVNVTAAIGAFAFGYVQDALGHRKALAVTLISWVLMTWIAGIAEGSALFWVAANLAGLSMGSSQSAGRAMVGAFAPQARLAEFYGLWTLATQLSAIIGPLTYGLVTLATDNNHRLGILATGLFFLVGLLLIAFINVERGRVAAVREVPAQA